MSTTASIQITGRNGTVLFYQECDGYPSFVLNHLPGWLGRVPSPSDNLAEDFLKSYGALIGNRGVTIDIDEDPLDNGEDADWVYLIDQDTKNLTVQRRQYTGDQSPVDPLCELDVILDSYKSDVRCSIGRAVIAISDAGYTITPPSSSRGAA